MGAWVGKLVGWWVVNQPKLVTAQVKKIQELYHKGSLDLGLKHTFPVSA